MLVILLVDTPRNRFKYRIEPWKKQMNPAIAALLYHLYASKVAILLGATLSFRPLLKSRLMFEIILGDLSCISVREKQALIMVQQKSDIDRGNLTVLESILSEQPRAANYVVTFDLPEQFQSRYSFYYALYTKDQ